MKNRRLSPRDREKTYRYMLSIGVNAVTAYRACYNERPYTHMRWLKYFTEKEIKEYLMDVK